MLLSDYSLETITVIVIGFTWVEMLIITLSYFIAFSVKRTFGVGAMLGYFTVSTFIYLLLFSRLVFNFLGDIFFFQDCATFFTTLGVLRLLSGTVLLVSIWKQHNHE